MERFEIQIAIPADMSWCIEQERMFRESPEPAVDPVPTVRSVHGGADASPELRVKFSIEADHAWAAARRAAELTEVALPGVLEKSVVLRIAAEIQDWPPSA